MDNEDSSLKTQLKQLWQARYKQILEQIYRFSNSSVLRSSVLEVALILITQFGLDCGIDFFTEENNSNWELGKYQELKMKFQLSCPTLENLKAESKDERLASLEALKARSSYFFEAFCLDDLILMIMQEKDSSCLELLLRLVLLSSKEGQRSLKVSEAFLAFVNSSVAEAEMNERIVALLIQYSVFVAFDSQLCEKV